MKRFSIVTAKMAGYGRNLVPIYGSSVLAAWAYDSTTEVFTVVFHSGIVKKYRMPIPTVQGFMGAKSKGGFYNRQIKKLRKIETKGVEMVCPTPSCEKALQSDCSLRAGNLPRSVKRGSSMERR